MNSELKSNLLIQILGALRNLCDIPATEKLLAEMGVCEQLQYTMTHHYNDPEVRELSDVLPFFNTHDAHPVKHMVP